MTLGKGEIARYEQFLLFQQCFQKTCFPGASKGVIVGEWVKKTLGNTLGIGENAGYQHFVLFPQHFLQINEKNYQFSNIHFSVCKCFQFSYINNSVIL